jgi:hypothetical protein
VLTCTRTTQEFGICPSFKRTFSVAPCQTLAYPFVTFPPLTLQEAVLLSRLGSASKVAALVSSPNRATPWLLVGTQVMAAFVPECDYHGASLDQWLAAPQAPAAMEGVIKLRGLPFTATKQDIVLFFSGSGLQVGGEGRARLVGHRASE